MATLVRSDPPLVKALAQAFRWQRMLHEGRYASLSELARAERIERGYLGKVLRLALLAPDLVEAVLSGTHADQNPCLAWRAAGSRQEFLPRSLGTGFTASAV